MESVVSHEARFAARGRRIDCGVGQVCNRNAVCVDPAATVSEAAAVMRTHHIGDVLVVEGSDNPVPVGVVTDRDIVIEVVALKLDPAALRVGDLLSTPLVTVNEAESCEDAARLMALHAVRRMPVVDDDGRLVGIVTLDDLLPLFATPLAGLAQLASRSRAREAETRR